MIILKRTQNKNMCTLSLELVLKGQCEVLGIFKCLLTSLEIDLSCPNAWWEAKWDAVNKNHVFGYEAESNFK